MGVAYDELHECVSHAGGLIAIQAKVSGLLESNRLLGMAMSARHSARCLAVAGCMWRPIGPSSGDASCGPQQNQANCGTRFSFEVSFMASPLRMVNPQELRTEFIRSRPWPEWRPMHKKGFRGNPKTGAPQPSPPHLSCQSKHPGQKEPFKKQTHTTKENPPFIPLHPPSSPHRVPLLQPPSPPAPPLPPSSRVWWLKSTSSSIRSTQTEDPSSSNRTVASKNLGLS